MFEITVIIHRKNNKNTDSMFNLFRVIITGNVYLNFPFAHLFIELNLFNPFKYKYSGQVWIQRNCMPLSDFRFKCNYFRNLIAITELHLNVYQFER